MGKTAEIGGRDPHDTATIDLGDAIREKASRDEKPKRPRGRPRKHADEAARKAAWRRSDRYKHDAAAELAVDLLDDLYAQRGARAFDVYRFEPECSIIRKTLAAMIARMEEAVEGGMNYAPPRLARLTALSDAYEAAVAERIAEQAARKSSRDEKTKPMTMDR